VCKLLETIQHEVQRKYKEELRVLLACVKDLKQRLNDELLSKEKEVKQLHLQHRLEYS
jgi:gluconate kinase